MFKLYRNNRGILFIDKYHFGYDGRYEYYKLTNKDIFYIHAFLFHFFFLKTAL